MTTHLCFCSLRVEEEEQRERERESGFNERRRTNERTYEELVVENVGVGGVGVSLARARFFERPFHIERAGLLYKAAGRERRSKAEREKERRGF